MNIELFRKIDEVIQALPEQHYQGTWETTTTCGTTRCIAGWAVALTTNAPLFDRYGNPTRETLQIARESGLSDGFNIGAIGRRLLDLTPQQAGRLFFTDDDTARKTVHAIATGGEPGEWPETIFDVEVE
jgi:hypothetical protein